MKNQESILEKIYPEDFKCGGCNDCVACEMWTEENKDIAERYWDDLRKYIN